MLTKLVIIVFALFKNIVLPDHNFHLSINNVILQQLRTCKYLGVMFDCLMMNYHGNLILILFLRK